MRVMLILVCLAFSAADAAEVQLRDGTVIVGTILALEDSDDLVVDTEHMDKVRVEWDAVEKIHGTRVVEVELFNGQRLFGEVVVDSKEISIIGDETTVSLPRDRVFSIAEVNETFWEGLEVYTDLSMNITRGNSETTQLGLGAGVGYDGRDFETLINGTWSVNEQTDAPDLRRATLAGSYTYRLPRNWQASGLLQFESDEQQGLDLRTMLGGAIGNRVYNQRHMRVDLFSGLVLNSEQFKGESRTESLEGLLGATYRLRGARGVDIDLSLAVLPGITQSGRLRAQFDGSLSFDLFSDLDFKLTVYDRYDNQPPEGNETNDTGFTLGLSWTY